MKPQEPNSSQDLLDEKYALLKKVKEYQERVNELHLINVQMEKELGEEINLRKKTQQEVSQVKELLENIPQMAWSSLPDGYEDYHNQKMTAYTGLSAAQAKGKGWQQLIHPDDLERTNQIWQDSLRTGQPYQAQYRLKGKDGSYRWFMSRAEPVLESGQIKRWFGTCIDIHQEVEAREQLEGYNQELIRINQVLDNFVYMAAHDLKSPVSNLQTLLQMVNTEQDANRRRELQKMIEYSAERLGSTINGLVEVISVESSQLPAQKISFDKVLHNTLADPSLMQAHRKGSIRADFTYVPAIGYIESYLESILRNLLTNAVKYAHPRRNLQMSITTHREDDFVVLTVADNGIGIDLVAHRDRIFKPFKRFTDRAHGTGVGLYIIKNIVEKNGGDIQVKSQLDMGTTFTVFLREYQ